MSNRDRLDRLADRLHVVQPHHGVDLRPGEARAHLRARADAMRATLDAVLTAEEWAQRATERRERLVAYGDAFRLAAWEAEEALAEALAHPLPDEAQFGRDTPPARGDIHLQELIGAVEVARGRAALFTEYR